MQLSLLSADERVVRVGCDGAISRPWARDADPLAALAGPGVFRQTVLLNLERATFIDSSGLGWLVVTRRRFADAGGRLVVHSVPPPVRKILQVVSLNRIIPVAADEAEAIAMTGRA